jgi:RNA 2',3'-cyclic 3'-phosphodiesterase
VAGARLFVAVWPGPALLAWLRSLDRPSRTGLRWTTEAQWHVTLRFAGSVDESAAAALRDALGAVASASSPVAVRAGPRPLPLGAGIWVLPVDGLQGLAGAVGEATATIGQPPPARRFRGHLTLARTRHPQALRELSVGDADVVDESWEVPEITLVHSTLRPDGARYEVVGRWALGGGTPPG